MRLKAKLRCVINRCINHLVPQLRRALHSLHLAENSIEDFILIACRGKVRSGKRIFKPQAELIYQVDPKTDITIGLPPGQNDLYQSRFLLLPAITDQTFVNREASGTDNNSSWRF